MKHLASWYPNWLCLISQAGLTWGALGVRAGLGHGLSRIWIQGPSSLLCPTQPPRLQQLLVQPHSAWQRQHLKTARLVGRWRVVEMVSSQEYERC